MPDSAPDQTPAPDADPSGPIDQPLDRSWQESALCSQVDPEAFFPERGRSPSEAKRVCESCDVREQCLKYALANNERFGVWGGLTTHQRDQLRRSGEYPKRQERSSNRVTGAVKKARDRKILRMVANDVPPKIIAAEFGISQRSVHRLIALDRAKNEASTAGEKKPPMRKTA